MARKVGSSATRTEPRIRRAAEALFARHGYAAVSMRDIAREVGIQAGAIYHYVPDKQTLLFELMRDHLVELLAAWKEAPRGDDPLLDFARFHIGFHLDRPDAVFIAYMELRNLTPENFRVIEGLRRDYETELGKILLARGLSPVDAALRTRAIIAMLTGITTWYRDSGPLSREAVIAKYLEMVRGLSGPPRRP